MWSSSPDSQSKPDLQSRAASIKPLEVETLTPQSAVTTDATTEMQQTVTFVDQNPAYETVVPSEQDHTRSYTDSTTTEFKNFFARPVKIYEGTWNVSGVPHDALIFPWTLWMRNERIANRLCNFANFRGSLKIKIVLNGNPFYFGSLMASYYPYVKSSSWNYTIAGNENDIVRASQRPHILLDATTSSGGEMTLPFFWDYDCFRLTSSDPNLLGQLWIVGITLLNAFNSTQPLNYQVFAWCEDVQLTSPTVVNVAGLLPQSGGDEYGDGPISRPAAILSRIAGALAEIPTIRPWALASKEGAAAVSKIAASHGYCSPRMVDDPTICILNQAADMATVDRQDTSRSLALNAKRELTIDPRTTGLDGTDEFAFSHLYKTPSILGIFPWSPTSGVGDIVYSQPVTPMLYTVTSRTLPPSNNAKQPLPCAWLAYPFSRWKGVMTLRVQVVASAYHRGRLAVVWDPVAVFGSDGFEPQVQHTSIIDLSETRDFSIDIAWGSEKPALNVAAFTNFSTYATSIPGTPYPVNVENDNGAVAIYILNPLRDPQGTTKPVQVRTWVSWKELELFDPNGRVKDLTYAPVPPPGLLAEEEVLEPQSGVDAEMSDTDGFAPREVETVDYAGGQSSQHAAASFLHGDPVDSWRACLKRYTQRNSYLLWSDSTTEMKRFTVSGRCWATQRLPTDIIKDSLDLMSYVMPAYAGYRGAVRFKVFCYGTTSSNQAYPSAATAVNRTYAGSNTAVATLGVRDMQVYANTMHSLNQSWGGTVRTLSNMSDFLEFEIPWYSRERFIGPYGGSGFAQSWRVDSVFADTGAKMATYDVFVAAADDFSCFFFRGVPELQVNP